MSDTVCWTKRLRVIGVMFNSVTIQPRASFSTAVAGNWSSPLSQHDRLHKGMHWRRLTP